MRPWTCCRLYSLPLSEAGLSFRFDRAGGGKAEKRDGKSRLLLLIVFFQEFFLSNKNLN